MRYFTWKQGFFPNILSVAVEMENHISVWEFYLYIVILLKQKNYHARKLMKNLLRECMCCITWRYRYLGPKFLFLALKSASDATVLDPFKANFRNLGQRLEGVSMPYSIAWIALDLKYKFFPREHGFPINSSLMNIIHELRWWSNFNFEDFSSKVLQIIF